MISRIFGLVLLAMGTSPANAIDADRADAKQMSTPTRGFSSSVAASPDVAAVSPELAFHPAQRAVANWRSEATDNLDLTPETMAKLAGGTGLRGVPRCVKLNNYWCIKQARWAGEIAADAEGHAAFASAIEGAIAAAMLLRRYYLDYDRRSALAILSRGAPAQCTSATAALGRFRKRHAAKFATLGGVAPYGIQNTAGSLHMGAASLVRVHR